jgi:hypothetical protein
VVRSAFGFPAVVRVKVFLFFVELTFVEIRMVLEVHELRFQKGYEFLINWHCHVELVNTF